MIWMAWGAALHMTNKTGIDYMDLVKMKGNNKYSLVGRVVPDDATLKASAVKYVNAHRHDADFSLKTLRLAMEARFSHDFKDKKEQFKAWALFYQSYAELQKLCVSFA